jgi:hypothetical protein
MKKRDMKKRDMERDDMKPSTLTTRATGQQEEG